VDTSSFTPRRPSRRSQLTAVATRLTLRPIANSLPANDLGVAVSRQLVARSMAAFGALAPGTSVRQVDEVVTGLGRVRGEWVSADGAGRDDAAILYLHGSGYAMCSPRTHRRLVSQLSAMSGLPVYSVDYRLAPRHRFPAAADDAERAFEWLVAGGLAADRIVVAGDSAGGHLAIDLTLARLRAGLALPAALVLLSPLADLTAGLCRERERVRKDPMISAAACARLLAHYAGDADPQHARLAHVVATDEVLPPTLIQAGGAEMLAGDAHHLHDLLTASGTPTALEVWPGQMHVFQAMPRLIPEADKALRRAADFVTVSLDAASARPEKATA
jgi:acetyl esterase/lipase